MTQINESRVPGNAEISRKYQDLLRQVERDENGVRRGADSPKPKHNAEDMKMAEACRDFEALFIRQMLDEMRRGLKEGSVLDSGDDNSVLAADKNRNGFFRDQMYQGIAEDMANQNGFGIGSVLFEQLYRQEHQELNANQSLAADQKPNATELVRQQKDAVQQRQAVQQAQLQNRFY